MGLPALPARDRIKQRGRRHRRPAARLVRLSDLHSPARSGKLAAMAEPVQAVPEPAVGVVETAQPETRTRARPQGVDAANDWLCAWCLNRVASEKDRFRYEGRSEFRFQNPAGVWFDIITFARTLGCRQTGLPTLEDTWFPGYAWSYCLCARCGIHLGWYYDGPTAFAGLIRERLVRAALILS